MANQQRPAFRILSLDGGGVRGYLSALILEKIEKNLNEARDEDIPLGHRFDLITGTSTGGIIALGLAIEKGYASDVVDFYEHHANHIFSKRRHDKWRPWQRWTRPKYDSESLKKTLQCFYRKKTLNDVCVDVCIPAVALQTGMPRLYKSDYFGRNKGRVDESLVDIALATSAAPTYFAAHTPKHSGLLVDGGLCANNPVLIAIIDALNFERISQRGTEAPASLRDLSVLSIGTGKQCGLPFDARSLKNAGPWQWGLPKVLFSARSTVPSIELFMQAQSHLADAQARFLLPKGKYTRINPNLGHPYELDDVEGMTELKNIADMTHEIASVVNEFFVDEDED